MKKLSQIGASFIGAAAGVLPSVSLAQVVSDPGPITPVQGNVDIVEIILRVVNYILIAAGALAVLFLIIGGVRYIISAGNENQIEAAKHTIFNAIIGVIVIILALVILNTVKNLLNAN